jgi:phosphatidylglycerol:prolipoprotein diacylglycerol transferase
VLEININPVIHLGPLEARWATIFTVLALAVVIAMGVVRAKPNGRKNPEIISGLILSYLIGSAVGGKLFYILDNWSALWKNPGEIILSPLMVMYGFYIGAIAGTLIYCALKKIRILQILDITAPGAMLGLAVYRIGCILTGCCYGLHSDSFCSVVYTNAATNAPFGKTLYPTEIFHFAASIMAFMVLWLLRKNLKSEGTLFLLMLVLLAATDLPIRLYRVGEPFLFGLQQAQLIGILVLLVSVPWLAIKIYLYRRATYPST